MANNRKAIIQTLLYSSLFNFPLLKEEIYYYLHNHKSVSRIELEESISLLKNILVKQDDFYTLRGGEGFFKIRKSRASTSAFKQKQGLRVANILGYIPTILFIGISGSVAVGNAKDSDDIDLFVITSDRSLYTTRLIIIIILQLLRIRRRKNEAKPQDKICLNMLVDEKGMDLKESQNIYVARELAQLHPLFERDGDYQKFLNKNYWIHTYLVNAVGKNNRFIHKKKSSFNSFVVIEPIFRFIEKRLIKRSQTREIATNHVLAFHPLNTKNNVLLRMEEISLQYNKYYDISYKNK